MNLEIIGLEFKCEFGFGWSDYLNYER